MKSLQNLIELYHLIAAHSENKLIKNSHYRAILCPRSSWPNMIYNFNTTYKDVTALIREIQAKIESKHLPQYMMCAKDQLNSAEFEALKKAATFHKQWAYMCKDLDTGVNLRDLTNFRIEVVKELKHLEVWIETAEIALMQGKKMDSGVFSGLLSQPEVEFYLAYENDLPVATSMLFKKKNVAGVYMIGTIAEKRQKGYGTAVTEYVLKRGLELGCTSSVLQATEAGEKIYTKLGFSSKEKIDLFDLKKPS